MNKHVLFNSVFMPLVFVQVGLPEEAEKYNDQVREEIRIPHTTSGPPPVGEERIQISELDDIAQLAFKGTKALNRIQSIVFDAAYYTNENLLISAPTGAGKTNIAMLTVLREIKNNIEMDVIKKDKFKVTIVFSCVINDMYTCTILQCLRVIVAQLIRTLY